MAFRLIVTLGPAILNAEKLRAIDSSGHCIYRINGAHVGPDHVGRIADQVRSILGDAAEIMIDLPGNKVRTANLSEPIRLTKGNSFELPDYQINFPSFHEYVRPGDTIFANDSIYRLEVSKVANRTIHFKSHSDGLLLTNKGLHLPGITSKLPFLFERDQLLIKAACKYHLNIVSLSFVRTANDVLEAKALISEMTDHPPKVFAKIETEPALRNLDEILKVAETVNVDRGDLSADIGIMNLPAAQEKILTRAQSTGREIFLATQFLKNMETSPVPLIAEVADLYKTIRAGVSGIQLSEETAVGAHAVECVKLVFDMVQQVRMDNDARSV